MAKKLCALYDKAGVVELARSLSKLGVEIISSGGTAKLLSDNGIKVGDVSEFTGFPEMMEGRVKTLHPKIHGAILADRSKPKHLQEAEKHGIKLIDLVVINLYPFEETILKKAPLNEVIEKIDIGGPTLLRAAAKNYKSVAVVVNPASYQKIIEEMKTTQEISEKTKEELALAAWEQISHYDTVIEKHFRKLFSKTGGYPEYLNLIKIGHNLV